MIPTKGSDICWTSCSSRADPYYVVIHSHSLPDDVYYSQPFVNVYTRESLNLIKIEHGYWTEYGCIATPPAPRSKWYRYQRFNDSIETLTKYLVSP